jgi:hypothetical protein
MRQAARMQSRVMKENISRSSPCGSCERLGRRGGEETTNFSKETMGDPRVRELPLMLGVERALHERNATIERNDAAGNTETRGHYYVRVPIRHQLSDPGHVGGQCRSNVVLKQTSPRCKSTPPSAEEVGVDVDSHL